MVTGLVVWLGLAAAGLSWVLAPYRWGMSPGLGDDGAMAALRARFPVRLAPFPEPAASRLPADEEEDDGGVEVIRNWIWRETARRFVLGFSLWMASGWFVHWLTSRIIHGPQRWRGRAQ